MPKVLNKSIDLPLEEQFRENWRWEDSYQRYELDCEFQDIDYFLDMDPEDFFYFIRKMDNLLMERGLSEYFIRNYAKANLAIDTIEKQLNEEQL